MISSGLHATDKSIAAPPQVEVNSPSTDVKGGLELHNSFIED